MVDKIHYRWDFIGLSTDSKPTPAESPKVVDGSTYYESDTSKLYVFYKDTWYEKTATGGGTSDFDELTNRPKYNGTAMTGETDIPEVIDSVFTGTDGVEAGTAGLVPAPETTDAGKFLKADGTWSVIGNGIKVLTSADFNYPVNNPDGIFWELLPIGLYTFDAGSGTLKVYTADNSSTNFRTGGLMIIGQNVGYNISGKFVIYQRYNSSTLSFARSGQNEFYEDKSDLLRKTAIQGSGYSNTVKIGTNSLAAGQHSVAIGEYAYAGNSSSSDAFIAIGYHAQCTAKGGIALGPYSFANEQGKVNIGSTNITYGYNNSNYRLLSGLYDGQNAHDAATVAQGNTLASIAPTTSTIGVLGQLYTDTTSMHTYQCTAIDTTDPDNPSYTWTQRW